MFDNKPVDYLLSLAEADLPDVFRVENASFVSPWTEAEFVAALKRKNCVGAVAKRAGRVTGFMVYEALKTSLRLRDLAVHPDYRRQGVGRLLANALLAKLSPGGRSRVTLTASEDSLGAHLFFRSMGFLAVGVERAPYQREGVDGYRFEYDLAAVPGAVAG